MTQYDFLNSIDFSKISHEIVGISLSDIVTQHPIGKRLFIDATSLHPKAPPRYYPELEARLLGYIKGYSSNFSYGSVGPNKFGDAFRSTLDYINLLQSLATKADAEKVEKLKILVIKDFFDKIGNYRPFLPPADTEEFALWEKAVGRRLPRYLLPKNSSSVKTQQPL